MSEAGRLRLHVSPAAETAVRRGHPWVFADRVRNRNREGSPGELAVLYDRRDRFLGLGLYDPGSPIRVRVLHVGEPTTLDEAWWRRRLESALAKREGHFDGATTGWRCLHGENDGFPGCVLDRYGDTYVLKVYSEAWLARLPELVRLCVSSLSPRSLVLRYSRNIASIAEGTYRRKEGEVLLGESVRGPVTFLESGIVFEAEVLKGQKTGFFLDQRENRRRVGAIARGAEVLNAFSFSGGFSLHAAVGGARRVVDVDISGHALASARRNMSLNRHWPGVASVGHESIQADAFEWLTGSDARRFDVVVLDPPSLARREAERAGALVAYGRLAAAGLARVRAGGWLVAASCSAHVTREEFFDVVRGAARRSGRSFEEVETTGHPVDHPAGFAEAHYLKAIYLRVR